MPATLANNIDVDIQMKFQVISPIFVCLFLFVSVCVFLGPPDKPSSVTISVASEDSLLVRFIEPLDEKVIVSKYKSEYE